MNLCVFCGSSPGHNPAYADAAQTLARELVRRDCTLVYGGGRVGLMGIIADAVLNENGRVIGVIPDALATTELTHPGATEMHVVRSMHERKAMMERLSDAFVSLPGGFGTFEETLEMITWAQLRIHLKPCGLLNINNYYDQLVRFLAHAETEGFLKPAHRALLHVADQPAELLERLLTIGAEEPAA